MPNQSLSFPALCFSRAGAWSSSFEALKQLSSRLKQLSSRLKQLSSRLKQSTSRLKQLFEAEAALRGTVMCQSAKEQERPQRHLLRGLRGTYQEEPSRHLPRSKRDEYCRHRLRTEPKRGVLPAQEQKRRILPAPAPCISPDLQTY
jgi:chromosome segregation ATPase